MPKREIRVAAVQAGALAGASKEDKVANVLALIEDASKDGAQIILPPELIDVDYKPFYSKQPDDFDVYADAEAIPGPTTEKVGELTKKYGNYVIMPLFEKAAPGIYYNAAATVGPDGTVIDLYRKTHLATVQALEKMYFRAGQRFSVWRTGGRVPDVTAGTIICHDRRYPESSRIVAGLGAEIMFCPTAAPGYAGGVHWEPLNIMRSVDTGMFTVYANRAGSEPGMDYIGASMIVNPFGEVIAKAGPEENVVLAATLDLEEVNRARIKVATLRDMRHDLYVRYYGSLGYDRTIQQNGANGVEAPGAQTADVG